MDTKIKIYFSANESETKNKFENKIFANENYQVFITPLNDGWNDFSI